MLALSDHVCQALGGSQVLTQVFLIRAASSVLPLDWPWETEENINHVSIYPEGEKNNVANNREFPYEFIGVPDFMVANYIVGNKKP